MSSLIVPCCCCRILSPTPFPLPTCFHLNPVVGLGFYVSWSLKYLTEWRSAFVFCNCDTRGKSYSGSVSDTVCHGGKGTVVRATLLVAAGLRDVIWQQTGSRDASKACPVTHLCQTGLTTSQNTTSWDQLFRRGLARQTEICPCWVNSV